MRIKYLSFIASLLLLSCVEEQSTSSKIIDLIEIDEISNISEVYKIDTQASSIAWRGFKPGSEQIGLISLSAGYISISDDGVVGGDFTIDMNSITVQALPPDRAEKLAAHLKDADFFEANLYPTSTFKVASLSPKESGAYPYSVTGNLTIKGITKSMVINFNYIESDNLIFVTTEKITLNRTDWGITYKSATFINGLKDNFISDNIEIQVIALFRLDSSE